MKKIKVLHTEWSDGWGGQEIRIINEMIALREKGVEVFLACKENSQIKIKAEENNIKVFSLPFKGNIDFKTMFLLSKIIKDNKINIINTHSGKDTWVGGIASKISGSKFIRTRHLSNRIRSSRINFINEIADYIFTTGESVKEDMIKFNRINPNKIMSIPTGIDDKLFDPTKYDKIESRKYFDIKDDEIVIGIVAILRMFKRHDLFIQAAEKLIGEYSDKKLKFIIAGDGPQRETIERLIKKLGLNSSIILLGHVKDVPLLLSALDVFVLTSDSKEGVPQSVMQALLMNKKVVATDVGSTSDLYSNNNFKLIKPESIDEIVNSVKTLISEDEKDNRSIIVNNFSKKVMTDKIYKIYSQILN